ncbi:DNA-binding transcriptional activator of the SARP family [Kytococcus aerolatus]|uniref:DNA-binding transcriptional activator of the SARP family n=1 Tax=Kytococcus aerolatus TaxID=592308 RepID=A0A212TBG8_9MICO|nr:BTAD domain-containing putative transcriptional regulator [Kytococcus aerolatus]SNC63383.1 DNA-binding transcriptional activator of the SARP family [Kytococcus aerolatus]
MRIAVLGPLEATTTEGIPLDLPLRERRVLEILVTAAPRAVDQKELVRSLWPENPPRTAGNQVQGCVARIRRATASETEQVVVTTSTGYRLGATVETDLAEYREHSRAASQAIHREDTERARSASESLLALWRGAPFPDAVDGSRPAALAIQLDSTHTELCERWWVLAAADDPTRAVAELRRLLALHPLRESTSRALMQALVTAGRSSEALKVYAQVRSRLRDELGVNPSPASRELHEQILRGQEDEGAEQSRRAQITSQLPPPPEDFVGREELREEAAALLTRSGRRRMVVLHGHPGIGKRATALQIAQDLQDEFPGGVLYVGVRGNSAQGRSAGEVLGELLSQAGVHQHNLPKTVPERRQALAERLAGREVLLVLDSVPTPELAEHVLPAGEVAALMTSRRVLRGLPGAHHLPVEALTPAQAVELLHRQVGLHRTEGHEEELTAIARLCGYHPYVLLMVAGQLRTQRDWTPAMALDRLRSSNQILPQLATDGLDLRTTTEELLEELPEPARAAFGLLSLLGEEPFPGWVVGALTGQTQWFDTLDLLVETHLLHLERVDELGQPRYVVPALTKAAAGSHWSGTPPEELRAAAERLVHVWWCLADQATAGIPPTLYDPELLDEAPDLPSQEAFLDATARRALESPREWLKAERSHLVQAVELAADQGLSELAARLALTLFPSFDFQWLHEDWQRACYAALRALPPVPNRSVEDSDPGSLAADERALLKLRAALVRGQAQVKLYRARYEAAEELVREAMDLFAAAGCDAGVALCHLNLVTSHRETHRREQAAEHARVAAESPVTRIRASARSVGGGLRNMAGDYAAGLEMFDQAVADAGRAGDDHRLGQALRGRGISLWKLGRGQEAVDVIERAVGLFDELDDVGCLAHTLRALGRVHDDLGHPEPAQEVNARAEELYLQVGRPGARGPYDAQARRR